ncbi:hypothetical protein BASA81_006903 [Batrachochytrium salamandrivorans]|nr:hypothetical protein BASA81_006903 [Batrachochytrium salamandrivorans]
MILNIRPLRPAQQLASQPHHNLGGTPRQSSNLSETFPQRRVRAATLNVDKEHDLSLPTDDGDIYPGGEDDAAIDPTQSTLMVLLQTLPNAMHSALLSPLQTVSKVYRRGVLEWNQTRPHSEREQVYCFGEESVMVLRRANGTRNGQAVWYQRDHSHGIAMRSKIRFPGPISVATGAFSATGRLFALASSGGDKGVTVFVLEHGSFELQEHEDGIPIAGQVAGLGFTPRHSSLLVCTKRGEVFCCLRQQQSALQFAPAVLLSSVVAANTAQPALMDTNFALLQGEKLYSSNTCAVSVCVLHEQSSPEQPPRLIPFQRIEFASSPLTLASTVDDVFRKALGIPPWCDLQQVQRCEVNSDTTKLAMTTGMHELVVVDVQTGRELGRRGNVLAFTWFSTWELAVLQHSPAASTLLVCSIEELQGNLMDPAVDAPTGLKSLCNGSGDAVTALGRNNALMLVQPCSPEQVLEQMLAGNDFHSALEFCARKHLPVDSVHKKMFDTNPVSSETIANHLAAVSDWDWVGATCLDRIPADRDNALALLQFGLDSSPTHFPHLQSEFQSQLQRLEAYRQTFAEFDSKSYQKFRVAPCANAIAEQLASQGMVRELHVFLLETVWGKEHAQASLACGFVSEAVPPAEYETLLKLANKSAEWYVNRALEIDDQSGLLRHALEMLEIGARSQLPPPLPLLEALDSAKHLVRLVYSLHLDFSLSLRVWMFNMPVADRIRVCYTDQLDLFVARVFPLYVDLSPVQQKPWLAAMQDFLSQVANLRLVHQVLFTTDLMYKNRVDGRLFVLQVMVNVLPLCGDDLEAFDRLWRDVNALDLAVETVMWPKRFAALRGELAEIHTRWKTQQLCQRRGLTVSMSTLKRAALEQDSALLNRFLDPIRLWQQGNDGDLVQYACDEAVRLGQFLSVSVDQVLVLALKQVLLNGALNHVVASVFNHKLGNELLIEAYGFALREWFLRDLAFPNALECLQTAPQGLELEPFGRLLQLAALLPPTVLSPAELLLGLECNSSELLKRIIIECDFSLALRAAPLLGIEMETLVSLLVQHGQLKQAQTMVDHVLLHSDAATELERFSRRARLVGFGFLPRAGLAARPERQGAAGDVGGGWFQCRCRRHGHHR